jgi:hypothetical protein
MCSGSILVTMAMVAGRRLKVPSLSSASTTIHSPCAHARVGAIGVDDPAIDHGGVEPARVQQRGDHRGGGGLAVGAGHRDVGFQPHQLGQHLGPAHHRQAARAGGVQFGVARLDRGGDHDDLRPSRFSAFWPIEDRAPSRFQPLGDLRALQVGALHRVAVVQQHLGDARHADAADADEMDRARVAGQFGGGGVMGSFPQGCGRGLDQVGEAFGGVGHGRRPARRRAMASRRRAGPSGWRDGAASASGSAGFRGSGRGAGLDQAAGVGGLVIAIAAA